MHRLHKLMDKVLHIKVLRSGLSRIGNLAQLEPVLRRQFPNVCSRLLCELVLKARGALSAVAIFPARICARMPALAHSSRARQERALLLFRAFLCVDVAKPALGPCCFSTLKPNGLGASFPVLGGMSADREAVGDLLHAVVVVVGISAHSGALVQPARHRGAAFLHAFGYLKSWRV